MLTGALRVVARRIKKRISARSVRPAVVQVDPRQLALELAAQIRGNVVSGLCFKALADQWIKNNSARLVAPQNEWRHVKHLRSLWEMSELALTPGVVRHTLSSLTELAAATRNKVRSTGKRIIQEAQENGLWGASNPFAIVKRAKEQRKAFNTLTVAEVLLILPHLREDRRREAKVSLLTGVRPGELLGLKKTGVDLEKKTIRLHRSHSRDSTKTGKERVIPIPDLVLEDLRAAMEGPGEYVFPKPDGRRQRKDTKLARTLRTAMGKAGLVTHYRYSCRRQGCGFKENRPEMLQLCCPKCDFKLWVHPVARPARFYDLRHSAATLMRKAGADPLAIKLTLGHASRDVTDDVYTHLTDDDVRREINKLKLGNEMDTTEANTRPQAWEARALPTELPPQGLSPWVEPQPLLTVKNVAVRLAVKPAAVYRLVAKGLLVVVRIGSLLRFRREDVEAFVVGGGVA